MGGLTREGQASSTQSCALARRGNAFCGKYRGPMRNEIVVGLVLTVYPVGSHSYPARQNPQSSHFFVRQ